MADITTFLYLILAIGASIGIAFGFIYFNPYRWANIKSMVMRKNYGLINFSSNGKSMFPRVIDFDKAIIRTMGGIWIVERDKIYRMVDEERSIETYLEDQVVEEETPDGIVQKKVIVEKERTIINLPFEHKIEYPRLSLSGLKERLGLNKPKYIKKFKKPHGIITPQSIEFRQGCPIVYLSLDDMLPMILVRQGTPESEYPISRNPEHLEKYIGKEVSAAELEALKMNRSPLVILILVVGILSLASIYFGWNNDTKITAIGNMLHNLTLRTPIVVGG